MLYVQWGNYITPSVTGLQQAALPVIWVAVGGRDSLLAAAICTFLLNQLTYVLSSAGNQYALVIVGALLVFVMLFAPEGVIVSLCPPAAASPAPAPAAPVMMRPARRRGGAGDAGDRPAQALRRRGRG